MLESLKPFYERILRPAIRMFQAAGITPNHLTMLGVVVFGVVGWLCAIGQWYWAAGVVVLGAFLDGWDGLLARETGQKSDFGAILDSTCDRLTELAWIGGLAWYYAHTNEWRVSGPMIAYAAIGGSLMVSYVKARCEGQGVQCRGGLLQRPERIILLAVCIVIGPLVTLYGLAVLAALAWFTVAQRMRIAYRNTNTRNATASTLKQ
jgi:CDP-diacylglycerol---glycerol-3-phosphate 3-phosphatidyltransferase